MVHWWVLVYNGPIDQNRFQFEICFEWNGKMFFRIFVFWVFFFLFFPMMPMSMDDRSEQQIFIAWIYSPYVSNWIWIQVNWIWTQLNLNSIHWNLNPNCWIEFYWMELNLISTKLTHFCHHFIVISAQQGGAHVPNCMPIPEHNLTLIPETLKQARASPLFPFNSSSLCVLRLHGSYQIVEAMAPLKVVFAQQASKNVPRNGISESACR
jgi:hypothetical protein